MLRFFISCLSTLALLAGGLLLWQSDFFPEKLPHGIGAWITGIFGLFHDPFAATFLYGLTSLIVLGSWFVTEFVVGLVYAVIAAMLVWTCLLGFLALHYPPVQHFIQALGK